MPTVALNDLLRVRVACYTPTQVGINTLTYKVTNVAGTSTTTSAIATALDAALGPLYKALISDQAKYRGLSVQRFFPGVVAVPDIVTASDGAGTVASDLLPGQVSGILSWRTVFAGPKYRGRIYVPFPGESLNGADGTPTAAYVTLLEALALGITGGRTVGGGGNTATITHFLYHRATGATDEVSSTLARKKWATQKRRGVYGPQNPTPF